MGIDLVQLATESAENDGRWTVTRDDMTGAVRSTVSPTLQTRAAKLNDGERALLCRIAELSREADATMTSGAVYEAAWEYTAIGKTTYHTRLKRLEDAGIVDLLLRTDRGRTRKNILRYDPDRVLTVCRPPESA